MPDSGSRTLNAACAEDMKSARYDAPTLMLRLDQAWRILNLNQELIRAADQKIYLLIVMSTLLVTYVSTNLEKIVNHGVVERVCLILFLVAGAAFFFFALTTVLARSRRLLARPLNRDEAEHPVVTPHLIFFGDISQRARPDEYAASFHQADLHDVLNDVCHQIHQVAGIANNKYRAYRRAWMALAVEVTLFLALEFSLVI